MFSKLLIGVFIISAVIETKCEYRMPEYTRIKRAKYYSSPPQRLYRRPPFSFPISGPYSNTPPPGYNMDDDEPPHPGNSRPYKVSKRPTNEGLGEEDIYNMVKYLSKQDLEKIIEIASEKNKRTEKVRGPQETYNDNDMKNYRARPVKNHSGFNKYTRDEPNNHQNVNNDNMDKIVSKREENVNIYKQEVKEIEDDIFSKNNLYGYREEKPYDIEYANKENHRVPMPPSIIYATPEPVYHTLNTQLDSAESRNPFNFVNTFIQNDLHENYPNHDVPNFNPAVDSKMNENEAEVDLPRPVNLREEQDYEVSYTNNVPTVTKAESYKIENFGSLPLMDYSSKLHSVSSYHVPRYTITSSKALSETTPAITYGPSNIAPPIEPAPPASVARAQSDANLKAIRIWTHKSRGTAYTLHNDGSLSLEKPGKPKQIYGIS